MGTGNANVGRATEPRIKIKPMLDKPRLLAENLGIHAGLGVVTKLWATLAALGKRLTKAKQAQSTLNELRAQRSVLKLLEAHSAGSQLFR